MSVKKARIHLVWLAMWIGATTQALAEWSISTSTSPLTGVTTTTLETSANYGRFRIYCSNGEARGYYLATDYVTGDGYVSYRIGTNPIVSATWSESAPNGYQVLIPPNFDLTLVEKLYKNWDFVLQYNSFVQGSPIIEMDSSGLPEAIDETRSVCNWPADVLPPGNGWGATLPTAPPVDAKEATYVPGAANQFRLIAWRDTNAQGKQQLLARLGDVNGPCSGPFYITDHRLYVTQNGKFVSAVSGQDFFASCLSSPTIVALNGDFDASGPFTLTSYPFHYHTTAPGSPMANVTFDQAPGAASYEGLWWNAPAGSESGWGLNVAHQGDIIFATWFTYDATGKGWWLVMTAPKTAPNTYSGTLYQTAGPPFSAVPFNPMLVTPTQVGTGTLTFSDGNTGTFAYTVNGISQTKNITHQVFGPLPTCTFGAGNLAAATNYQDLWWAAPAGSESGWGVNFTQEGDTIFATWFTYDLDGTPMWLVVTAPKTAPGTYAGTLYRTTGPAFNAVPFNPASVVPTAVGTATLSFTNGNAGTFAYTVNGVSQAKAITREVFQNPGTVCN